MAQGIVYFSVVAFSDASPCEVADNSALPFKHLGCILRKDAGDSEKDDG